MEELIKWENLKRVLNEYGAALRNHYQDKLIEEDKIATGNSLNTAEYVIEYDDNQIMLGLRLQDYYRWVENGRGPGKFPPVDKMIEYIHVKPIIPREGTNGRLPTEQQLAFLIGRKIAQEGIEAGHQLRDAEADLQKEWMDKIDDAITEDVKESITVILTFFKQ